MTGMRAPLPERLWRGLEVDDDDCWLWTGALSGGGYGRIWVLARKNTWGVHQVSYELHIGPIPEGLTIDHLCHSQSLDCPGGPTCKHRRCANPGHLEAVTIQVNLARASPGENQRIKTHCPAEHPYDEVNTFRTKDGERRCRICRRENLRRYREKQRSCVSAA